MRYSYPNLARPKKAAKAIAAKLGIPLASAQTAVARAIGYSDWHDLEQNCSRHAATALDQQIQHIDYIERQVELSLALAEILRIPSGDAQYALANSHLTGDRAVLLFDQIEIRTHCWRRTVLPFAKRRNPGEIGKINLPKLNKHPVILRSFGEPTTVIRHSSVSTIADFEYISPRIRAPLFVPMRLYLPYGYWTEHDGAKVLFSRDYKPMWRIRNGAKPERLEPWLWIQWREETWLWNELQNPWDHPAIQERVELFLSGLNINSLPILADALPILVLNSTVDRFSTAIEPLSNCREAADMK